jgi:uncharacterized iron-regulated protein
MAYNAVQFLAAHPEQVLMILVGDFHAQYFGGLPDRLRARGIRSLVVVSQLSSEGLSPEELQAELQPHPRWGARGDYLWVTP